MYRGFSGIKTHLYTTSSAFVAGQARCVDPVAHFGVPGSSTDRDLMDPGNCLSLPLITDGTLTNCRLIGRLFLCWLLEAFPGATASGCRARSSCAKGPALMEEARNRSVARKSVLCEGRNNGFYLERQWLIGISHFQSVMGHFGVLWPLMLGDLASQVAPSSLSSH